MPNDLDKMARMIHDLQMDVQRIKSWDRPSYATGVLADILNYPNCRGLWPFSSTDDSLNAVDISGQSRTLFQVGNPPYSSIGNRYPYVTLDGSTQYYSRNGINVQTGLTLGGWFYFDATPASVDQTLIARYNAEGSNRSYLLNYSVANGGVCFTISSDGTVVKTIKSTAPFTNQTWHCIVGRFNPYTSVDIYFDGIKNSNTTAIPTSVYNSTAYFTVGALGDYTNPFDGRIALCFMFGSTLDDSQITYIYNKTRVMFGV